MDDANQTTNECPSCKNEPEPGFVEMPNNGPIVPCWVCNWSLWRAQGNGRYVATIRLRGESANAE